jgi:hypothetical protein
MGRASETGRGEDAEDVEEGKTWKRARREDEETES